MNATPREVMEGTVIPILNFIKANIASALSDMRTDRADAKVSTEVPKDYFIYEKPVGYKIPAVFVLGDSVDFQLQKGQNYIASVNTVYVSVVVDDRNAENLVYKCWRYQDALHAILDQAVIDVPGGNIKNVIKVTRAEFSNQFQPKAQQPGSEKNPFRKEVMLTLAVEHFEKR